ncbi:MAG TPA: hypothetical protein VNB49_00250 [Candidatus Dormibacteraeota bacterium]|nr:hypothetical protein [Candidatus Dormibacteraeota bacterium]
MSAARRLLIVGGIGLALLGMIYGVWYAVFAEHQELDGIGRSLTTGFSAAAKRDSAAADAALKHYKELKYAYDRHVDVHSHWIGLAMVLIVLGIGLDRVNFSQQLKMFLAAGLLLGSLLFPLGVLIETFVHGPGPRVVAVAGSALVIGSLAGMTLGFVRDAKDLKREMR